MSWNWVQDITAPLELAAVDAMYQPLFDLGSAR